MQVSKRCNFIARCPLQGDCRRDPDATLQACPMAAWDYFNPTPRETAQQRANQLQGL